MVRVRPPLRLTNQILAIIFVWSTFTFSTHAEDQTPPAKQNNTELTDNTLSPSETKTTTEINAEVNEVNIGVKTEINVEVKTEEEKTEPVHPTPTPIAARNLNPFIQIFGIPLMETATLIPVGKSQIRIHYDISNNSASGTSRSETAVIDGETYRTSIIWRKGMSHNLELGVEIPFISHTSGLFDRYIGGWHDILQLTNNRRDNQPNNSLSYYYFREYGVAHNISCCGSDEPELGDIRFFATQPLIYSKTNPTSFTVSIKAPTGKESKLKGSGDVDFSIALNGNNSTRYQQWQITTFGQIGLIMIGQNQRKGLPLANLRREAALFGGYGASWRYHPKVDFKAQLNAHTSMYNSDVDALGGTSIMLSAGLTFHLNKHLDLDLAIGENLFSDPTPDLMLNSSIAWRY